MSLARIVLQAPYGMENAMKNLILKNITPALMLLWGVGMAFTLPPIAAAGFFCSVVVPTTLVTVGKKYAIPFAVLGVVWLVIAIIIEIRN